MIYISPSVLPENLRFFTEKSSKILPCFVVNPCQSSTKIFLFRQNAQVFPCAFLLMWRPVIGNSVRLWRDLAHGRVISYQLLRKKPAYLEELSPAFAGAGSALFCLCGCRLSETRSAFGETSPTGGLSVISFCG